MYAERKWDEWTEVFKYFLTDVKQIISINCMHDSMAE